MAKHLRITITIPVSDDPFESAQTIVSANPLITQLKTDVASLGGQMMHEMVGERPGRKAKGADAAIPAAAEEEPAA